mgnify:CR=1 FL=1
MIWGIQWDETLKWLIDTGEKTYAEIVPNSTSWGNYFDNSFTYYTDTSKSTATKSSGTGTRIPSGAYEGANANNVYDLAGNVFDWILDSGDSDGSEDGIYRCSRGGYYSNAYQEPAAGRCYSMHPYQSSSGDGLRCSLFIK